ncbi:hypothetical protein GCM10029963_62810 [Micromonospora andamanensis]
MTAAGRTSAAGRLDRMVRQVQAQARVPAISAAVHRADRQLWTCTAGGTGTDTALDEQTRFRIGSVTKTFTAVLVMQCRDDGLLDLDDPLRRHLDLPAHGELTVRRLLSHTAGLQREPYGDVWDTLRAPDAEQLVAGLARAERVLPTGRRYHYSNLGMALLGHLVGQVRGGTWAEVLSDRVLTPLGLTATTVTPGPRAATGFLVDAYSDEAHPEPPTDFGAVGPAAQLWSTAADMARWAAFLADPAAMDAAARVLAPTTLDEMRWPVTVTDEAVWAGGFGLGLILVPQGSGWCTSGTTGRCPASSPGCTAGGAARAPRPRSAPPCWAPRAPPSSCWSCRTGCSPPRSTRIRPTSIRGGPAIRRRRSCAGCSAGGGVRASSTSSRGTRGRCGPVAPLTHRESRRRSSPRCRSDLTCSVPSPGGRTVSCSG